MEEEQQQKSKKDTPSERKMDRKRRREEGKQKKRKLIEESGGVRPRKPKEDNALSNLKPNHPKKGPGSKRNHQFGRVMDSIPCRNSPRTTTLSIAIPGSIVANCQTKELKTQLVGQIARSATIYHVDEIIVFDDKLSKEEKPFNRFARGERQRHDPNNKLDNKDTPAEKAENPSDDNRQPKTDPHAFFAHVLQYCETPQYLRRHFFPMHTDLQFVGLLAPIDAPHHVRADDHCKYREGVVLERVGRNGGSLVNCGIPARPVEIATKLQPGIRCTIKLDPSSYKRSGQIQGEVVSPSAPRLEDGTYWGYTTRTADSLQSALNDCPWEGGKYDLKIGTSERGSSDIDTNEFTLPVYKHALVVFGGVAGIEECVDADESLNLAGSSSHELFDIWINICKYQASRTIRTEEAVLIALAKLSPKLMQSGDASNNNHKQEKGNSKKPKELPPIDFGDEESMSEESSEEE